MRPLNARSIALSTLLGTHPPTLPASSLVAFAELFGINGGTMRTALSRLVAAGDLELADGRYTLAARLRARQAAQDSGRRVVDADWDGRWHTAITTVDHRDLADRRHVRSVMANHRFAELRPTVWMRPANLPAPVLDGDWLVVTAEPVGTAPGVLTDRLWALDDLATQADDLRERLADTDRHLRPDDPGDIPPAFTLAAEALRFLRSEPLLPRRLTPTDWPVDDLRSEYEGFEKRLQSMMAPFLRDQATSR